jgi:hypothetical protein
MQTHELLSSLPPRHLESGLHCIFVQPHPPVLHRPAPNNTAQNQAYQLLNCDDHAGYLKKHKKDPAHYRPDIAHQVRCGQGLRGVRAGACTCHRSCGSTASSGWGGARRGRCGPWPERARVAAQLPG